MIGFQWTVMDALQFTRKEINMDNLVVNLSNDETQMVKSNDLMENRKVDEIMNAVNYGDFTKKAVYKMYRLMYEMVEEEIVGGRGKHNYDYFNNRYFKERIVLPEGIREIFDTFYLDYVRWGLEGDGYPDVDEFEQESEDTYGQLLIAIRKEAEQDVVRAHGEPVWSFIIGEMFRLISDRYIRPVFAK